MLKKMARQTHFRAHETHRMEDLAGLPLARFWQRFLANLIDLFVAVLIWAPLEYSWKQFVLQQPHIELKWDFHEKANLVVMVLYWGLTTYFGNGKTVGKWTMRTRVVSLVGERIGLWQSVERALGYGAAMLEAGLGFAQFFWDRNRQCAQDRLAETIVIDERKRSQRKIEDEPEV